VQPALAHFQPAVGPPAIASQLQEHARLPGRHVSQFPCPFLFPRLRQAAEQKPRLVYQFWLPPYYGFPYPPSLFVRQECWPLHDKPL